MTTIGLRSTSASRACSVVARGEQQREIAPGPLADLVLVGHAERRRHVLRELARQRQAGLAASVNTRRPS
jgi:hypothetical protein